MLCVYPKRSCHCALLAHLPLVKRVGYRVLEETLHNQQPLTGFRWKVGRPHTKRSLATFVGYFALAAVSGDVVRVEPALWVEILSKYGCKRT